MTRMLAGLAVADFRDRVRRPAYVVILLGAALLGYVAVPSPDAKWMIMQLGDHRGIYNSAYVGTVTALASGLWLTLCGFYIVRNSIERDRSTRVGHLLAAAPLRTSTYLAGKFLSNLLLLGSMLGVLACTALVMQLARGESRQVDLIALWQPFLLVALPLVALTAALALLFESLPLLRTGLGNVLWFCMWLVIATAGQGPGLPLDGIGVNSVVQAIHQDMVAQDLEVSGDFSLGLTYLDDPLSLFVWDGFTPNAGYVLDRLAMVLLAAAIALLPALWFGRFDPARSLQSPRGLRLVPGAGRQGATPADAPEPVVVDELSHPADQRLDVAAVVRTRPETGSVSIRMWLGEIRVLVQGVSWWWWTGAALLLLAGLSAPLDGVTRVMLPLAWVWPMLIWSRLGTQSHEHGVGRLLGAYPAVRRRVAAEWSAGFTLTAVVGSGPLLRLVAAAEWAGVAAWVGGALFIPSLALALGALSRTHRLFQAIYLPLWYTVANGLAVFDYMGALRAGSDSAHVQVAMTFLVTSALLVVVVMTNALRRFDRD
ncbi:ABC transporter permease [Phytoactinopolyspora limicola]|uniref:ABC transporter permease n=1 Tax=Phytoactinopolyspora limicola TaxID=2715536 RepID=UPI00140C373B|nr:ABC transporter permease [Phytoactinopolyspora limicola]